MGAEGRSDDNAGAGTCGPGTRSDIDGSPYDRARAVPAAGLRACGGRRHRWRLAFLAGAVPLDAEGNLVGPGDFEAQTRQVLANMETALRAVGCGPGDVVSTDVYVVSQDPADLGRVWAVVQAAWA